MRKPDVIIMDIRVSEWESFEAARQIMTSVPIPIILVSANWEPTEQAMSFQALEAGAVACLLKPPEIGHPDYAKSVAELLAAIKQMSEVKVVRRWLKRPPAPLAGAPVPPPSTQQIQVVALGASTGGPQAIQRFLARLPADFPAPILIVQHIARGFARGFVDWLNTTSPLPVYLAAHRETIGKSRVYVAPDDAQMGVAGDGKITLTSGTAEHSCCPSVSHLFRSVAKTYGRSAVGILLSGMGKDGAAELKMLKDAGGITYVQDKASSVVHGMPGEAIFLGGAMSVLPADKIGDALLTLVAGEIGKGGIHP
jgi:two-component system chemotaxis response regulator CheB